MAQTDSASQGSMRAYLFESWVVFLTRRLDRAEHRHGVLQLSISLTDAPHDVVVGGRDPGTKTGLVNLIAANNPHSLMCSEATLVAWIEPESELGERLSRAYLEDADYAAPGPELQLAVRSEGLDRALEERWQAEQFRAVGERVYGRLVGAAPPPDRIVHRAVRKALRTIRADPSERIRASELAEEARISESRFLHLFSEQVGMPLRAYVRWRRVFGALALVMGEGTSATDAAAEMGFSDSAHLTRVMTDFLAISPSRYSKRKLVNMEIVDCTQP